MKLSMYLMYCSTRDKNFQYTDLLIFNRTIPLFFKAITPRLLQYLIVYSPFIIQYPYRTSCLRVELVILILNIY